MPKSDEATAALEQRFIIEYLKDYNATQAGLRAGLSAISARTAAQRLLKRPHVKAAIAAAEKERMGRVQIAADDILRALHGAAFTDPNEIVQVRRGCCRHCYGIEHRYQYTDQRELNRARNDHLTSDLGLVEEFEHGGIGFDPTLEPDEDCPQCGGDGGAYVHVADTRNLSPGARALYAGAKQTKDGIEVKMHSQEKARELLMRHMGMLNDKLELTGDLAERILRARRRAGGR